MGEKARVLGSAGGALGLGALAAAIGGCCGVPWVVALIGVSGALALARLSFLLPYALVGAAVLLVVAFWWAYRPIPVKACADSACNPSTRRALRIIVCVAMALVVALAYVALTSE